MREPTFEEAKKYYYWSVRKRVLDTIETDQNKSVKSCTLHGDWEYNDEGGTDFCLRGVSVDGEELEYNDYLTDALWNDAQTLAGDSYYDEIEIEKEDAPVNLQVIE